MPTSDIHGPNAMSLADVNPVKALGKRIGILDGKPIFKHEEAYYFDHVVEKSPK